MALMIHEPAASETGDPLLLTPGPLTTSAKVKQAMVHDWGSRDAEFLRINRMVLDGIVALAAVREVLDEMRVGNGRPALAAE